MPITVGIPFYNSEKTLKNAVRSVFSQTFNNWELILVDDGSTDGSLDIACAVKDRRVRVISDGENRGLPARLNQIVVEARYDLIARMDADDMMSPNRFDRQLDFMVDPGIQIVTSGMAMLSEDGGVIGYRGRLCEYITLKSLLRGRGIAHAPILGRTSWFERNPYDESVARVEDAELWCRAYTRGCLTPDNVAIIDEPLYFCNEESGVTLGKVMTAHGGMRNLIMKYGPEGLGYIGTVYELTRSLVRSGVLAGSDVIGLLPFVTSRVRNKTGLDPYMLKALQQEISQVLRTRIPGIDY